MNEMLVGFAMLVSSTAGSPPMDTSRATLAPTAFILEFPQGLQPQPEWRRMPLPVARATTVKRFNKTDRFIAVGAGIALGWVVGGAVGFRITAKSNSADDMSGLPGFMVGAPFGAIVGGVLGYRFTK